MTEVEFLRLALFLVVFYHLVKWGHRLNEVTREEREQQRR